VPHPHLRRARIGGGLAAVLVVLTGCGFLDAMAHPEEQAQRTTETAASTPPASPTRDPDRPVVVAQADLAAAGGGDGGALTISVGPVVTGLVLPFLEFFEDCPVEGPSLQYVPVVFEYSVPRASDAGLAGHLTVTPGPATPADIGDVGVFFNPSPGHDEYCQAYPPLPATDTFWARGVSRVTGYVVLDEAVTAAAPQGRAAVFPTLPARIDTLRVKDVGTGAEQRLTLGTVRVGTPCGDDPSALCVRLG